MEEKPQQDIGSGNIIVPKKTVSSFFLGVAVALAVLFIAGAVYAATVYDAGGGQLSNLGEPSATGDAAKKNYVDTATGRAGCPPKKSTRTNTLAVWDVTTTCTSCSGLIGGLYTFASGAGSGSCMLEIDGVNGSTFHADDTIVNEYPFAGEFASSLKVWAYDTSAGTTDCTVYYCDDQ